MPGDECVWMVVGRLRAPIVGLPDGCPHLGPSDDSCEISKNINMKLKMAGGC